MNFRRFIQDYFTFTRSERKGITILLILVFLLGVANKVVFYFEKPKQIDINLLDSASSRLGRFSDSINQSSPSRKLFVFNPNTIDSITLDSLDIPPSVKLNLMKFRNRNGKIYSATDFKKIYGVTDEIYFKIEPYLLFETRKKGAFPGYQNHELFQFDPNTATDQDFIRLGLSQKQIQTIRNYLNKGGCFRRKDDFLKIWGLSIDQKTMLTNYIVIEDKRLTAPVKKTVYEKILIDLNSADSLTLKQLPGIGEILSKRIVKYRDLLGGFYSLDQLHEVYGLNEQTIHQIENMVNVDSTKIKKLDLNFADMKALSKHPYIKRDLANKIVKFRASHGNISNLADLRNNMILNKDEYTRLRPYF